jgi:molybdopterin-biosynthesis enzyme MoeA-like protein
MRFGTIIIGDELLSGKRQDKHFSRVIHVLAERGLELGWCRIIGDDPGLIVETLRQTMASDDMVFCFGGIGATPDDHTRACAAQAAGVALEPHAEAVKAIEARFGEAAYPQRIRLAELPVGSAVIPNPYNRIPGFSLSHHHFLPGFPEMAWPMMTWLLDRYYRHLHREQPPIERSMVVWAREGELLPLMQTFVENHPRCRLSSLPELNPDRPRLELGVRGEETDVRAAVGYLQHELTAQGITWQDKDSVDFFQRDARSADLRDSD